ncbi:dipeptidase [Gemmatimonadota bacterium]
MIKRMFKKLLPVIEVAALFILLVACGRQMSEEEIQTEAEDIHAQAWVVDTHLDSPSLHIRNPEWIAEERHVRRESRSGGYPMGRRWNHLWDIPRMIEGGADAVFLAVAHGQWALNEEEYTWAKSNAIASFDWIHAMTDASPNANLALSVADAERLHRSGKRAIFIGVENGYPIGTDIANVEDFYNRGMRYMTLSHAGDNQICASSIIIDQDREDFGLTHFGREVVGELNRLGIMIDCSHISKKTFFDVIEITRAPVIASHSAVNGINDHVRNFSDEMLLKLKENNGVIQLCPLTNFIRAVPEIPERDAALADLAEEFGDMQNATDELQQEYRAREREINIWYPIPVATMDDFIKCIDYAVNLIGIDHVGFGSDFDGGGSIAGLEDISQLPNLTVELLRRGYSSRDIEKFWGGNLLRVFREVENTAGN